MNDRVALARSLMDSEPDAAHGICVEILRDDPDNPFALFMAAVIMIRADRQGIAIPMLEKVVKLRPQQSEGWKFLGMAYQECHVPKKAREAFEMVHRLKPSPSSFGNIGVTYLDEGKRDLAIKWCNRAIELDPNFQGAKTTLGFAQLGAGDWKNGWKNYETCLGGKFRKRLDFGAPDWDGSPVERLIVYGEQGLGDEIMFASILPDVMQRAKHVTLECDPRLEGLFKRSFPSIEVHGTRREEQPWLEGRTFDAQVACGSLPSLFRPSPESCPGVPYLQADPERRIMWRALFDSWKKPVIGLTWSGGRPASQKKKRTVGLESFRSVIESTDAVFVSLQYLDPQEEIERSGLPVRMFAPAMSSDYDDMAAFVSELDYIVGIHTTAHHLAGALGKSSTVLVPALPMWNYAHGDKLPWYRDNVFHRQRPGENWDDCIKRMNIDALRPRAAA